MDTSLLLIRHAETVWNREGRMQGNQDSPLSEVGTRQAEALGERLRALRFDAVYSSDSQRCLRTARIALDNPNAPLRIKPQLRERHLGDWEGRLWREIAVENPEATGLYKHTGDFRPPNGESFFEVQQRVQATIDEVAAAHPGGKAVVFSSGGTIRAAVFSALKLSPEPWSALATWNTGITRLDLRDGNWRLVRYNDAAHLAGTGDSRTAF